MNRIFQMTLIFLVLALSIVSLGVVFDWITFDVAKDNFVRIGLAIVIVATAAQVIRVIVKKS